MPSPATATQAPLAARLAEFAVATPASAIPDEYLAHVATVCFDGVGVMLSGAVEPLGQAMRRYVAAYGGMGTATLVGTAQTASLADAALANGTFAHAEDFDDQGGHFASFLLGALLPLGETDHRSGAELAAAYAIGVETAKALRAAGHYFQNERGFHGMNVYGNVAATAAAARLAGLNPDEGAAAISIACSAGCGVVQNFGSMGKPLHAGQVARNSVQAALLARSGYTASEQALDGPIGYLQAYLGTHETEPIRAYLDQPFQRPPWEGLKKYPCCGSTHGAIDAVVRLKREHGFTAEDVQRVEVANLPYFSHVLLYPDPATPLEGKFSLPYTVAVALVDGPVTREAFTPERLADPRVRAALAKVDVRINPKWHKLEARPACNPVRVFLHDGRVLEAAVDRYQTTGSVWNPLAEDDLQGKFLENAARALGAAGARDALRVWRDVTAIVDVACGTEVLRVAEPEARKQKTGSGP